MLILALYLFNIRSTPNLAVDTFIDVSQDLERGRAIWRCATFSPLATPGTASCVPGSLWLAKWVMRVTEGWWHPNNNAAVKALLFLSSFTEINGPPSWIQCVWAPLFQRLLIGFAWYNAPGYWSVTESLQSPQSDISWAGVTSRWVPVGDS